MAEKIKCPNPKCESGRTLIADKFGKSGIAVYSVECPTCHGTGQVDAPKPKESFDEIYRDTNKW